MFDIYVRNVAPMDEETAMGVCGLLPQIFGDAMDGYDESIPFYEKVKAEYGFGLGDWKISNSEDFYINEMEPLILMEFAGTNTQVEHAAIICAHSVVVFYENRVPVAMGRMD